MSNTAKTRSTDGAVERAKVETAALAGGPISESDFIISRRNGQGYIESLLPRGEANAVPTKALLKLAGLSDARAMQKQIESERAKGALILSKGGDGGGYFLPTSRAEIARYEQTLRRRALSTLRTLKTARRALKLIDGQTTMEDY